jgi:hypothetical protein
MRYCIAQQLIEGYNGPRIKLLHLIHNKPLVQRSKRTASLQVPHLLFENGLVSADAALLDRRRSSNWGHNHILRLPCLRCPAVAGPKRILPVTRAFCTCTEERSRLHALFSSSGYTRVPATNTKAATVRERSEARRLKYTHMYFPPPMCTRCPFPQYSSGPIATFRVLPTRFTNRSASRSPRVRCLSARSLQHTRLGD